MLATKGPLRYRLNNTLSSMFSRPLRNWAQITFKIESSVPCAIVNIHRKFLNLLNLFEMKGGLGKVPQGHMKDPLPQGLGFNHTSAGNSSNDCIA